ncbi:MAG: nucleotidyltransferase domain-containing protein [Lachnospiraceae bacterium]|nr:nucleotidyltransferase domain-containing protein [Lachnospiraceae bacterium]
MKENETIEDIRLLLQGGEYEFLGNNPHLGKNILFLCLGGSYAYGTNTETSDVDLRGCTRNTKHEILTGEYFEQFVDEDTDTIIYSFHKLISLLVNVNPNTIEMLGCRPEHYLYISPVGQELLNQAHLFLSKRAVYSFGGYANAQLQRLNTKAARHVPQPEQEQHILNTINHAFCTFPDKYFTFPEDSIRLYIDKAVQKDFDTEIFMDVNLHHYPLRDYKCMWSEMHTIVKSYAHLGHRNKHAIEHNKIGKHMMHLLRLYMMCLDILEKEEIITYREKEHALLTDIRNGKYQDDRDQPTKEFFEIVHEYECKLDYAKEHTNLPEVPDQKAINDFVEYVNEKVVKGE